MISSRKIKNYIRPLFSVHRPNGNPATLLTAIPRGGSTWIMEVLGALSGTRMIAEPFNVRVPEIEASLDIHSWAELLKLSSRSSLVQYLQRIDSGAISFLDPNPLVQRRFITNRTLFKVIHLPAHISEAIAAQMGARFLCLVRHPVPVSLSRKVFPILDDYLQSEYRAEFTESQNELATELIQRGSHLEKGVLAWCLQFEPFLRDADEKRLSRLISYERCVAETEQVLSSIKVQLEEHFPAGIKARALSPSRVLSKSDAQTQLILKSQSGGDARVQHLIARGQKQVTKTELSSTQSILDAFGVDLYCADSPLPINSYAKT
jgi:hypothetical protein